MRAYVCVGGRAEGDCPVKGDPEGGPEGEGFPCSALDLPLGLELAVPCPTHFPTQGMVWHPAETGGSRATFGVQIFFYLWETTTCDHFRNHISVQTALAIQSPTMHRNVSSSRLSL